MAKANPATEVPEETTEVVTGKPNIQYYGEGAKDVKFEVDPRATLIRVYGTGVVLVDY